MYFFFLTQVIFRIYIYSPRIDMFLESRGLDPDSEERDVWAWTKGIQEIEDPPGPHDASQDQGELFLNCQVLVK